MDVNPVILFFRSDQMVLHFILLCESIIFFHIANLIKSNFTFKNI